MARDDRPCHDASPICGYIVELGSDFLDDVGLALGHLQGMNLLQGCPVLQALPALHRLAGLDSERHPLFLVLGLSAAAAPHHCWHHHWLQMSLVFVVTHVYCTWALVVYTMSHLHMEACP